VKEQTPEVCIEAVKIEKSAAVYVDLKIFED
jgi:hypothetical protein